MEVEYPSAGEDSDNTVCSDLLAAANPDHQVQEIEAETEELDDDKFDDSNVSKRKNSFVWRYFRPIPDTNNHECVICNGSVGNQVSNLSRHLAFRHEITKQGEGIPSSGRGRPSRSFIWKFCTKENSKYARCHFCNKLLYSGGGNTTNVAKHLRRKHPHLLGTAMDDVTEAMHAAASINPDAVESEVVVESSNGINVKQEQFMRATIVASERRERKGGSYVWNYCDKLSRHTIRCKLCQKVMSFHGTANVITHLQRKHNIVGKVETDGRSSLDNTAVTTDISVNEEISTEYLDDNEFKRTGRSPASASTVWKYCTRISKDAVRCRFCDKNLSYQGTSNLQRHLHRMHGVVLPGRAFRDRENDGSELKYKPLSSNFIWEHCTALPDGERTQCKMCTVTFNCKNIDEISKHLTHTHAIEPPQPGQSLKRTRRRRDDSVDDTSDDYDNYDNNDNWQDDAEIVTEFDETNIKKDESIYDDIIIEEQNELNNEDEDPFDPYTNTRDIPLANPLSPQSSHGGSPDRERKHFYNSKQLAKLNEERVRQETEYFREKAGFYRMQKYLTALQAKKVRVELQRLSSGVVASVDDLNGAYVTVESMQHDLPQQQC